MKGPKQRSCKIGTQPAIVVMRQGSHRIIEGREVWFRKHDEAPGKWTRGVVRKVNDDGYFFLDLL